MELNKNIANDWQKIKKKKPLLHHITNFVVMNETANITLCLGALPVMSHAKEEVRDMVKAANALVLNIGTLTPELIDSMILAGTKANEIGIPIILDPVGAGATKLRTAASFRLLKDLKIDIVRGNPAEISILAGQSAEIRGVESISNQTDAKNIAQKFAKDKGLVVAITGKEDIVSDGKRTAVVQNGHSMLSTVTGTGCMATTAIAAFAAVNKDHFMGTIGGLVAFGLAGEKAAQASNGLPGTFHTKLYDTLVALKAEDIVTKAKVRIY